METADDVRDNRTKDVGDKRDHKKREQHYDDHVAISCHQSPVNLCRSAPILRNSVSIALSELEAIVPNSRRTDKVGIFSERRQHNFCLLVGNKPAAAADHLADTVKK